MNDVSPRLPKEPTARKIRADAFAIIAMGLVTTAWVMMLAVRQYLELFVAGGISWSVPVEQTPSSAQGLVLYRPDPPFEVPVVSGTLTHLQVVVPNVNTVSTVFFAISIALAALVMITVIACVVRLAWLFQQGRFFTIHTSYALRTLTWTLVFGGLAAFGLWQMGANGVEAALGVRTNESGTFEWWGWYWILLFAVTAFGLVDVALRRAIRLQHETEGLV